MFCKSAPKNDISGTHNIEVTRSQEGHVSVIFHPIAPTSTVTGKKSKDAICMQKNETVKTTIQPPAVNVKKTTGCVTPAKTTTTKTTVVTPPVVKKSTGGLCKKKTATTTLTTKVQANNATTTPIKKSSGGFCQKKATTTTTTKMVTAPAVKTTKVETTSPAVKKSTGGFCKKKAAATTTVTTTPAVKSTTKVETKVIPAKTSKVEVKVTPVKKVETTTTKVETTNKSAKVTSTKQAVGTTKSSHSGAKLQAPVQKVTLFDKYDTNHDGVIDRKEFKKLEKSMVETPKKSWWSTNATVTNPHVGEIGKTSIDRSPTQIQRREALEGRVHKGWRL